jgi:hypothetical protein
MKKPCLTLILLTGFCLFLQAQSAENHLMKVDVGVNGFPGDALRSAGLSLEVQELTGAKLVFGIRGHLIYAAQGRDYLPVCLTGGYYFAGIFAGGGAGVMPRLPVATLKLPERCMISASFPGLGLRSGSSAFQMNIIKAAAQPAILALAWVMFFSPGEQL